MNKTIKSAIKRFKEENMEISTEDTTEEGLSDLSASMVRDIVRQEIDSNYASHETQEQKTPTKEEPLPITKDKDKTPKTHSEPVKRPEIKLPKKSNSRSTSRRERPVRPLYHRQEYTELQPINIQQKTKYDLIPYNDERIKELLEEHDCELFYLSPISTSSYMTPDVNMKRCQILIETLKKNDYLYFPVYLYDSRFNQILAVVFIVFNATVKTINLSRSFNDMFNLVADFSRRFIVRNLVYWKLGRFILRQNSKYYYLNLNSSEEVIKYLCGLNGFKIDEYCELRVNPFCSDKIEYLDRHVDNNELCEVFNYAILG